MYKCLPSSQTAFIIISNPKPTITLKFKLSVKSILNLFSINFY